MELWVRSQDKEKLLKVDELSLIGMGEYKVGIGTFTKKLKNDDYCNYLGIYKDKKRALEILDEIQNLLKPQIILRKGKITGCVDDTIFREPNGYDIKELSTYVYEMPKE